MNRAISLDNGSVFSLRLELRIGLYAAVVVLLAGLALFLKENMQRVGPVFVVIAVAAGAALCYAYAERARRRDENANDVADYILLLGALIISADVGYAETQFRWLGADWPRYLPVLALLHGLTAYRFCAPLVLSVALTAFAAWLGIEPRFGNVFTMNYALPHAGGHAFLGAGLMLIGSYVHRRAHAAPRLLEVLEHFTVNMALMGALMWCFDPAMRWAGLALLVVIAAGVARIGLVRKRESLLVYAILYTAVGIGVSVVDTATSSLTAVVVSLMITVVSSLSLIAAHGVIHGKRR